MRLVWLCAVAVAVVACSKKEAEPSGGALAAAVPDAGPPAKPKVVRNPKPTAGPTGTISGTVRFAGDAPKPMNINFGGAEECKPLMDDPLVRDVEVHDGGLSDVFVYVIEGLRPGVTYPVPTEPLVINNLGCRFTPTVFGLRAGQKLEMVNSDPVLHTFSSRATQNIFNYSVMGAGKKFETVFKSAEAMALLLCEVHPWMNSYVGVMEHPFFDTTDSQGHFSFGGLEPGSYLIEAWHRALPAKQVEVVVSAGADAKAEFQFSQTELPAPNTRRRLTSKKGHLGWLDSTGDTP